MNPQPTAGDRDVPGPPDAVLAEVAEKLPAKPVHEYPDGTGPAGRAAAEAATESLERARGTDEVTWRHVLRDEVLKAFAEEDPAALRAGLVQVAVVTVEWIQALDLRARSTGGEAGDPEEE